MFKKTELTEIKGLSVAELIKKLLAAKKELMDLAMDKNMGKQKDVKLSFKKRKKIAQLSTILKQKQLLSELEKIETDKEKKGEQVEVVVSKRTKSVQKKK